MNQSTINTLLIALGIEKQKKEQQFLSDCLLGTDYMKSGKELTTIEETILLAQAQRKLRLSIN